MICLRCGREMKKTNIEGCYQCIYCHIGLDDLVYRTTTPQPTAEFVDMSNKDNYELKISSLEKEHAQLREEIEILQKALELAVSDIHNAFKIFCSNIKNRYEIIDDYIQQAKEMLNEEHTDKH